MKKLKTRVLAFLMLISLVMVTVIPSFAEDGTKTYSSYSNSGKRDEVCVTLDGTTAAGYYTGNNTYELLSSLSASELEDALQMLMKSTHKYISSYSNCRDYAVRTDCENENGKIILLYTSYEATYSQYAGSGSNGWNREHVWPKSLGANNTNGGGADLHHIRPDDYETNADRGNKRFGEVSGGTTSMSVLTDSNGNRVAGGTYNSSYFEPNDNAKGDVARIILYMYVRYASEWGCDSVTEVFQSVDVLLEWCALDPVDTWEMGRNEVVYAIQGNRNVFIDYPEYAWLIFDREIPGNMQTPSGKAAEGNTNGGGGNENTPGGGNENGNTPGGDVGTNVTNCKHTTGVYTVNAKNPTCTEDGYSGDDYCNLCNQLVVSGMILQAEGHTFGETEVITPATEEKSGLARRVCSTCGEDVISSIPKIEKGTNIIFLIVGIAVGVVVIVGVVIFLNKKRKGDEKNENDSDGNIKPKKIEEKEKPKEN